MIPDSLIIFFASYFPWLLTAFLLAFIFFSKKHSNILQNVRITAEAFLAGIVSRFGFTEIIRYFYDRPRPFEVMEGAKNLIGHEGGGSFPSGHAAFFFALAATLFLYDKKWGSVFLAGAILIGAGRVLAGVHFASDILGGAVVGILASVIVNFLARRFLKTERR